MPACWPVFHFPTVIHKYTVFPLVQWLLNLYPCFSTLFFLVQNGYWAVFTPSISRSNLEFYPCPPGYCACTQSSDVGNTICVYTYTNSDPGRQCACDREGIVMWMCSHLSVKKVGFISAAHTYGLASRHFKISCRCWKTKATTFLFFSLHNIHCFEKFLA